MRARVRFEILQWKRRWDKICSLIPMEVVLLPMCLFFFLCFPPFLASIVGLVVSVLSRGVAAYSLRWCWPSWPSFLGAPVLGAGLMLSISMLPGASSWSPIVYHLLLLSLMAVWLMFGLLRSPRGRCGEVCSCSRDGVLIVLRRRTYRLALLLTLPLILLALLSLSFSDQSRICLCWVNVVLFSLLIICKVCYLLWVMHQLERESWVPVMNDQEQVIGRTPLSAPESNGGRLPLVRLVAISQGMIYLEQQLHSPEGLVYDTPFDGWLTEDNTPTSMAQMFIDERFCGLRRARPHLVLHYHGFREQEATVVYLFSVMVGAPDELHVDCRPSEGKWWCARQLREQIGLFPDQFSESIRSEYPYLLETALLADSLAHSVSEGSTS